MVLPAEFLEAQRGMLRILGKQRIRAARCLALRLAQPRVGAPETWPHAGSHSRLGSSGSSPSAADARRKLSRRGRGCGWASRCSHASSVCRANKYRAKSVTSACLSGGNASQTWMSSDVVLLMRLNLTRPGDCDNLRPSRPPRFVILSLAKNLVDFFVIDSISGVVRHGLFVLHPTGIGKLLPEL